MKRAALALALLVAAILAIVLALRGRDDTPPRPGAAGPRASDIAAMGTAGRPAPRGRRVNEETDAPPVARRIQGEVVDETTDDPVAGVEILVARRTTPVPHDDVIDVELPGDPEFRATSSADGKFAVDVRADGPWFVTARAADRVDAVTLASAGDDVTLKLARGVEKTFTVRRMADRAPITGAEITLYDGLYGKGPPRLRRVADEHGEARMRVASDRDMLVVRAKGYARGDRWADQSDLLLVPGYRIAGVVRDRAGHGVAGAELTVYNGSKQTGDADGRFVLEELAARTDGHESVKVTAESFAPWSGWLYCGDTDAVVELSRIGAVAGTVVLPDGSPAADAEVVDWTAYSIAGTVDSAAQKTNGAGAFRVPATAGKQRISATWKPAGGRAADELFGSTEVDAPDGGTVEGVVIRLGRKSFVPLRIVDASGRAVTDVKVRTRFPDDREVRGDLVLVSVEKPVGTALDLDLSDGAAGGPRWQDVHVSATTQATTDAAPVDVRLPALREFIATVLASDGRPVPASELSSLSLYDDSGEQMHASAGGEAGSKTWTVDPARRYALVGGKEPVDAVGRLLTPDEIASGRVTVRLDAGVTVRGRIVATDPNAVIGARPILVAAGPDRAGLVVAHVVLDADGRFHADHVGPGTWRLVVRGQQFTLLAEQQVQVVGDADVDVGDVALPARAWLHGVVRTPDGLPCGGAVIRNIRNDDDFRYAPSVVSQADGSFDVYVPATGSGALLVTRRGFGAAVARLDGVDLASPLDVRLAPEGTLDIRIRLPHAGARFDWYVQTPDGAVRWQPPLVGGNDTLGFDERHECAGLAPGPVVVVIQNSRSSFTAWKFTANVTVVAGTTTTVVVGPDR